MAYRSRGLPSTGCDKCRARRVKCDETRPSCERCQKIGFTGCKYRDEFQRTWRVMGVTSQDTPGEHDEGAGTSYSEISILRPLSTPPTLRLDHEELYIINRFHYDWTPVGSNIGGLHNSWLHFLPDMWKTTPSTSLLPTAVRALAYANHGQRFLCPKSLDTAAKFCGQSLSMLKYVVQKGATPALNDELMVAVLLLGMYETMTDETLWNRGSWNAHMNGIISIIRMRNAGGVRTPIEPGIVGLVFVSMVHFSMARGAPPSLPLDLIDMFYPEQLVHTRAQSALMYDVALLNAEWRLAFHDTNPATQAPKLYDLVERALVLSDGLAVWARNMPPQHRYTTTAAEGATMQAWLRPLLEGEGAPRNLHHYSSQFSMLRWRLYWSTRLVLIQALCYTVGHLRSLPGAAIPPGLDQAELETTLLDLVDRLCECCLAPLYSRIDGADVPATAKDIRTYHGYTLLQPSSVVSCCLSQIKISGVDLTPRRVWLRKFLTFFKEEIGFSKAAALADMSKLTKLPILWWGLPDEGEVQQ